MAVTPLISPLPIQHFVDSNGNALSGGKLFTYAAGTTTKQATYTDSTGSTQNTNPVILNTRGEANVWFDGSLGAYKLVLSPSTDGDPPTNAIWTVDQLVPQPSISTAMQPVCSATTLTAALNAMTAAGTALGNTFTAGQILKSVTAGASVEEFLTLLRNKGAGVANDFGEALALAMMNSSSAQKTFARLYAQIKTATAGAEDGILNFDTQNAGTLTNVAQLFKGLVLGSPTGGDKGVGSLNATNLYVNGLSVTSGQSIAGTARKMKIVRASNTTATVSWDEVVAETSLGGTAYKSGSQSFTLNAATTGAGGLDTGSLTTSTFYMVYAIFNPTSSTWNVMACTSAASSSTIYGGANMPAGYTASALIGVLLTDGSSHFLVTTQYDREVYYQTPQNIFTGTTSGAASTLTSQSVSAAVPSIALTCSGLLGQSSGNSGEGWMVAADATGYGFVLNSSGGPTMTGINGFTLGGVNFRSLVIITSQTIYWSVGVANVTNCCLSVVSFSF